MKKAILIIIPVLFISYSAFTQSEELLDDRMVVHARMVDGDTLIMQELPEVMIFGKLPF